MNVQVRLQEQTQLRMYSAPTMVVAYALMVRLMVEITTAPLGTASAARDLQKSDGSATCSITCNKNIIL
jgi:aconitase A